MLLQGPQHSQHASATSHLCLRLSGGTSWGYRPVGCTEVWIHQQRPVSWIQPASLLCVEMEKKKARLRFWTQALHLLSKTKINDVRKKCEKYDFPCPSCFYFPICVTRFFFLTCPLSQFILSVCHGVSMSLPQHDGRPYCHKPCYAALFGPKGKVHVHLFNINYFTFTLFMHLYSTLSIISYCILTGCVVYSFVVCLSLFMFLSIVVIMFLCHFVSLEKDFLISMKLLPG